MTMNRRELLERCFALGALTIAGATSLSAIASAWDEAEGGARQPTPWCELGPFYKRSAPHNAMLRGVHDPGMPLSVAGTVYNVKGELLRDATVEVWQTDNAGHYDVEGYRYRAVLQPDQKALYKFDSVMPGHYPQRVCQHVHYLVQAPGHKPLITQLYFSTDPVFEGNPDKNYKRDPLITSRELVRPVMIKGEPKEMFALVNFDIVLEKA